MKRFLVWCSCIFFFITLTSVLAAWSLVAGEDDFSNAFRSRFETRINQTIARLSQSTAEGTLTKSDKALVKVLVVSGIFWGKQVYPEAAMVLSHYLDGEGAPLELPSDYFQKSEYLNSIINEKKNGTHGPIAFRQKRDWRLSLALNPIYLTISEDRIKLYHPKIQFAQASQRDIYTVVPIGKLNIVFFDNLVSALNPTPFHVFSEWARPTEYRTESYLYRN